MRTQSRDIDIVGAILLSRCATTSMIAAAFFNEKTGLSRCRRRLGKLYDGRIIDRHFIATGGLSAEAIYTVGKVGLPIALAWCRDHGVDLTGDEARTQSSLPSLPLLSHTLLVAEAYLAFRKHLAADHAFQMDSFLPELVVRAQFDMREGTTESRRRGWRTVLFKPDGAAQIRTQREQIKTIFLEVDAGTESSDQLYGKFRAHKLFLDSGQFHELYGEPRFVTLTATTGTAGGRVRSIADNAAAAGADFVLTTTMDELRRSASGCRCLTTSGEWTTILDHLAGLDQTEGAI